MSTDSCNVSNQITIPDVVLSRLSVPGSFQKHNDLSYFNLMKHNRNLHCTTLALMGGMDMQIHAVAGKLNILYIVFFRLTSSHQFALIGGIFRSFN